MNPRPNEPSPIVIFANTSAGRGKAVAGLKTVLRVVREMGREVLVFTDHPESIAEDELPSSIDLSIVLGGDGTIRSVVNRLMKRQGALPPILPISMGTANLLCQHLKLNWNENLRGLLTRTLQNPKLIKIDVASANDSICLMMASAGFDAQVVHELTRTRTGPIHLLSYITPTIKSLLDVGLSKFSISIDGKTVWKNRKGIVIVANLAVYGTGFPMAVHAKADDGLLDICAFPIEHLFDVIELAAWMAVGEHLKRDGVLYAHGKDVVIESDEPLAIQVDGDAHGHTPLHVRLLAAQVGFIVPANDGGRI